MNIPNIVSEFIKLIKNNDVVAIGTSDLENNFLNELIKQLIIIKKDVYFVPTTTMQAKTLHDLSQKTISLTDREIDVAIEFIDQIDQYFNFIKRRTKSFIRDKMISQSALNLVVVTDKYNLVPEIDADVYLEISTFAWQRTILNLQSYGFARVVLDSADNFVKTEIGHYLARVTLDKNISLDDFEYSVRNIPGVLETGVFIGTADTIFIIEDKGEVKIKTREK